jgi:hypothetical protein
MGTCQLGLQGPRPPLIFLMQRILISLALCAGFSACVAPAAYEGTENGQHSAIEGIPGRVTYLDYRTSNRLTLLNEAHTDPLTLYTEKRSSPSTKVTANEVFAAMLSHFDDKGFRDLASTGYAPVVGDGDVRTAIEIETGGSVKHILVSLSNYASHGKSMGECRDAFLAVYNLTQQNQAVDNSTGKALFDEQERELQRRQRASNNQSR